MEDRSQEHDDFQALTPETKCHICLEQGINICGEKVRKACARCNSPYGIKHAAKVSPAYCEDCMKVIVTQSRLVRVDKKEHYDEDTDKVYTTQEVHACNKITFEGVDNTFYSSVIAEGTTEELRGFVIYHKAYVRMLEHELLTRQIKARTEVYHEAKEHKTPKVKAINAPVTGVKVPKKGKTLEDILKMTSNSQLSAEAIRKLIEQLAKG